MARSGKKNITIQAPVMVLDNSVIWMEKHWMDQLFAWMRLERIKVTGYKIVKNQKLRLDFKDAKMATVFALKYDNEIKKKIFRTPEWS